MPIMTPPATGVKVRMYRQGHGDCFLLAFPKAGTVDEAFYMLIDCGLKSNSEVHHSLDEIITDLEEATNNFIDLVVVTHEHEDHVNGFWRGANSIPFENINIGKLWLAWTEDPDDDVANELRDRFQDTLLGLLNTTDRLKASGHAGDEALGDRILEFLEFEMDGSIDDTRAFALSGERNKRAMQYLRQKAQEGIEFLEPHEDIYTIPEVAGVNFYVLGPPKDSRLLLSKNPRSSEEFTTDFALDFSSRSFFSALGEGQFEDDYQTLQPFAPRYRKAATRILDGDTTLKAKGEERCLAYETYTDTAEDWRRIDNDWLYTAELLALRLNKEVNNTSLVLAIELVGTGRVLLFTGDAQRGNWVSWDDGTWTDQAGKEITAKELLGRTVLYKVGHHGSHNATLNGTEDSDYANLDWMARGAYKNQFVAMIPANKEWAYGKSRPWKHPLKSIEDALLRKAKGRVFITNVDNIERPATATDAEWQAFQNRIEETSLYFDYEIPNETQPAPDNPCD